MLLSKRRSLRQTLPSRPPVSGRERQVIQQAPQRVLSATTKEQKAVNEPGNTTRQRGSAVRGGFSNPAIRLGQPGGESLERCLRKRDQNVPRLERSGAVRLLPQSSAQGSPVRQRLGVTPRGKWGCRGLPGGWEGNVNGLSNPNFRQQLVWRTTQPKTETGRGDDCCFLTPLNVRLKVQ